jgi:CDGSH-type Zn-finger protein
MEKGKVAGKTPQMVELEAGKTYAWCACGKSANQPWCDGSHAGSDFTPIVFKAEEPKKAALCMCKQTKNPPYCDGSHMSLEK